MKVVARSKPDRSQPDLRPGFGSGVLHQRAHDGVNGSVSASGHEVPLAALERAASADGTQPDGTVYLLVNKDVRARTRAPAFANAAAVAAPSPDPAPVTDPADLDRQLAGDGQEGQQG